MDLIRVRVSHLVIEQKSEYKHGKGYSNICQASRYGIDVVGNGLRDKWWRFGNGFPYPCPDVGIDYSCSVGTNVAACQADVGPDSLHWD